MPVYIDQTGRNISLNSIPRRIISLVPSQTELLYDLGLREEVVGITKFCIHPDTWFQSKARVGGTKQIKKSIIEDLRPDLIIANKEENVKEQVEDLAASYPVWISDVNNLNDAYEMIVQIGAMTGKEQSAQRIVTEITANFSRCACDKPSAAEGLPTPDSRLPTPDSRLPTAYLIWRDPYMAAGGDCFINAMLEIAGFKNVFADSPRYPEVSVEDLRNANCELLFLSSEPFPFQQKHIDELQPLLPNAKIILVDGEMFSWYGSRLLKAASYFKELRARC